MYVPRPIIFVMVWPWKSKWRNLLAVKLQDKLLRVVTSTATLPYTTASSFTVGTRIVPL